MAALIDLNKLIMLFEINLKPLKSLKEKEDSIERATG